MNEEELKNAVREYIDSIKNEPWYDVSYDDIILEGWTRGVEWLKKQQAALQDRKVNLYECASLFAESMNDKFPHGCSDGSAILLITTDGKRISSLIDGGDDLIRQMVANLTANDKSLRILIADGIVAAIKHSLEHETTHTPIRDDDDEEFD